MSVLRPRKPATLLIYLLLALALTVGACESEAPNVGITMDDIANAPESYYGTLVTVSGDVGEVHSQRSFTMGSGERGEGLLVASADTVPVVAGRSVDEPFVEDDVVQVTGYLHPYEEVVQEYDLDLPPELEEEFSEKPVLVAARSASVYANVVVTPRGGPGLLTDLNTIAAQPNILDYAGRQARFNGEVQEKIGDDIFWISGEGDARLLVVLNNMAVDDASSIETGSEWTLSGMLREIPTSTELQATWDLTDDQITQLEGDDVYLHANRASPN